MYELTAPSFIKPIGGFAFTLSINISKTREVKSFAHADPAGESTLVPSSFSPTLHGQDCLLRVFPVKCAEFCRENNAEEAVCS